MLLKVHSVEAGEKLELEVKEDDTLDDVISRTQAHFQLPSAARKLFAGTKRLKDTSSSLRQLRASNALSQNQLLLLQRAGRCHTEHAATGALMDTTSAKERSNTAQLSAKPQTVPPKGADKLPASGADTVWQVVEQEGCRVTERAHEEGNAGSPALVSTHSLHGSTQFHERADDASAATQCNGKQTGNKSQYSRSQPSSNKRAIGANARAAESLPLPPVLQDIMHKFESVLTNYIFCQQRNLFLFASSLYQCGVSLEDLALMEKLCPGVVKLCRGYYSGSVDEQVAKAAGARNHGENPSEQDREEVAVMLYEGGKRARPRAPVSGDDPSMRLAPLLQGGVAYGAVYASIQEQEEREPVQPLPTFVHGEQPSCALIDGHFCCSLEDMIRKSYEVQQLSYMLLHSAAITAHYSHETNVGREISGKAFAARLKANFRLGLIESVCDIHDCFLKKLSKRERGKYTNPLKCADFHPKNVQRIGATNKSLSPCSWSGSIYIDYVNCYSLVRRFDVQSVTINKVTIAAEEAAARESPQGETEHSDEGMCMRSDAMDVPSFVEHLEDSNEGLGRFGQIWHKRCFEAKRAQFSTLNETTQLHPNIDRGLRNIGVHKFFTHQAEAIDAAFWGQNVVVATSTASGKSICYNVPVLEELLSNEDSCAIYMFPTKALAQDQLRALKELTCAMGVDVSMCVYDGDTPHDQRKYLRENSRLLITNPDMLHVGMLPCHNSFARFFHNLQYVVLDEAHSYRGNFGSNTAMVLRRLRRICLFEHKNFAGPQFIVSSATIANPREHVEQLTGVRDVRLIDNDGSPRGEKVFMLWNPPLKSGPKEKGSEKAGKETLRDIEREQDELRAELENVSNEQSETKGISEHERALQFYEKQQKIKRIKSDLQRLESTKYERKAKNVDLQPTQPTRKSPIYEISRLLTEAVQHGLRCIAFCKTRKLSELVLSYTRDRLRRLNSPELVPSVCAYRAGYTASERRDIEGSLFRGQLRAVAATNALELGIDVGALDVTLHLGFPGTVASLWQQSGRAGRREQQALSVYIAFDGPLDQYFMLKPEKLFTASIERAIVDTRNLQIVKTHATCAAYERALLMSEAALDSEEHADDSPAFFGTGLRSAVTELRKQNLLGPNPMQPNERAFRYIGPCTGGPAKEVSMRQVEQERFKIIEELSGEVVEEIEATMAFYQVYEGAIYMNQGRKYLVKKLDLNEMVAYVRLTKLGYYTSTRDYNEICVKGGVPAYPQRRALEDTPQQRRTMACCNEAEVTRRFLGYRKISQRTGQPFDKVDLDLPDVKYDTDAAWIRVPDVVYEAFTQAFPEHEYRAALHAASHALLNVLPLYIMCLPSDCATECDNPFDSRYRARRLLIYDQQKGGSGVSYQASFIFAELLQAARELVDGCECESDKGCPACIHQQTCNEYNAVLHKGGASLVLRWMAVLERRFADGEDISYATQGIR